MREKNIVKAENYFEIFLIIFFIGLFIFLIHSFILPLLLAATLVFLFYKPYQKLLYKTRNEAITSLFMLFLVVTMILLPVYLISISLVEESTYFINNNDQIISALNLDDCNNKFCQTLNNNINVLDSSIENALTFTGRYLVTSFDNIFSSISNFFMGAFIFILAFFFLLKDGDIFIMYVKRIIPMKNEYKNALFLRFREVTLAVFIDSILVAILQGTLLGIGLWMFGIPSALFWGIIGSFFALLPIVGTTVIWIPAATYLYLSTNNAFLTGAFVIYCMTIVGLSDNLVRSLLIKNKTKVHPFLILISILGGIQVFGFLGLFLGPIIISMLISVLKLYNLNFH